jgi:hypothetical protein
MKALALGTLVILGACVTASPPVTPRPLDISADSAEYAPFRNEGTLTLAGQAFLTTRGGDVNLAAGRLVTLDPATSYAVEWFRRFGGDPDRFEEPPADPLFRGARRTTTANAEGRFRFTRLPPSQYIVRTTVTWETGSRYDGSQGGVVAMLVSVSGDTSNEAEIVVNELNTTELSAILGVAVVPEHELRSRPFRVLANYRARPAKSVWWIPLPRRTAHAGTCC